MKVSKCLKKLCKSKILLVAILLFVGYIVFKKLRSRSENFEGPKKLTYFYMNGCGHCDKFTPEWDKWMRINKSDNITGIKLEQGDAQDLVKKHDVTGFPTVLLLGDNDQKIPYEGPRTVDGLTSFCQKHNN